MTTLMSRKPQEMPTSRREPFGMLREELERVFSPLWSGDVEWFGGNVPSIDMSETDKAVEVRLDLPGINPKEIEVKLVQGILTISGERKEEKEQKGRKFYRLERRTGQFSRSIPIPMAVAEDEVVAEYKDGVLTVILPKTEASRPRSIPVKA